MHKIQIHRAHTIKARTSPLSLLYLTLTLCCYCSIPLAGTASHPSILSSTLLSIIILSTPPQPIQNPKQKVNKTLSEDLLRLGTASVTVIPPSTGLRALTLLPSFVFRLFATFRHSPIPFPSVLRCSPPPTSSCPFTTPTLRCFTTSLAHIITTLFYHPHTNTDSTLPPLVLCPS